MQFSNFEEKNANIFVVKIRYNGSVAMSMYLKQ